MTAQWLIVAATLGVAAVFGGMLFFAAVFAPLVFRKLPAGTAGPFIREVFPAYYASAAAFSLIAGLVLVAVRPVDGALMIAVGAGFAAARGVLMPRIDRQRARDQADGAPAGRRFNWLHRLSVWLNLAQLLVVAAVLVRLAA